MWLKHLEGLPCLSPSPPCPPCPALGASQHVLCVGSCSQLPSEVPRYRGPQLLQLIRQAGGCGLALSTRPQQAVVMPLWARQLRDPRAFRLCPQGHTEKDKDARHGRRHFCLSRALNFSRPNFIRQAVGPPVSPNPSTCWEHLSHVNSTSDSPPAGSTL